METTSAETKTEKSPEITQPRRKRIVTFVRNHPGTTLLLVAGAGTLAGGEIAMGALIGGAAALLINKKTGKQTRDQLRERARRLLHIGHGQEGQAAQASPSSPTESESEEKHA